MSIDAYDEANSQMSKLVQRPPVGTIRLNFEDTNVTTGAWVEIEDSLGFATNGVELFNGSGSILKIATGANGSESELPYSILPGGSAVILGFNFAKGVRLSVRAVDQTADAGYLILNFFG
jgi:hypothetical protein